jgi:hypothetical protein
MKWTCHSVRTFPRVDWLKLLSVTKNPSPYLLPEWPLFWEMMWPGTRAELWTHCNEVGAIECAVPVVRRGRFGLQMCHSLPMGTPYGPMGDDAALSGSAWLDLHKALCGRRTVEWCRTGGPSHADIKGWTVDRLGHATWIIDALAVDRESLATQWSPGHRRNVREGNARNLEFRPVRNRSDVSELIDRWQNAAHRSRIVLNRRAGPRLCDVFSTTDALLWESAWWNGRPVATALFLVHANSAVYVDGAVVREQSHGGANHALFARILASLAQRGIHTVDLGSGPGGQSTDGLDQFKRGWGARSTQRRELRCRRRWYAAMRKALGTA